jgi:RNA polymerase-binding transcription factor DksA
MNRTQNHFSKPQVASGEIGSAPSTLKRATSQIPSYEFSLLLNSRRRQLLEDSHGTLLAATGDDASNCGLSASQKNIRDLLAIDGALARIGEGVFGVCIACGSEIDRGRLKSDPTSDFCQPCEVRAADDQN